MSSLLLQEGVLKGAREDSLEGVHLEYISDMCRVYAEM